MTSTKSPERKSRVRRPDLDTVYTINEDGSRNFLHPADVKGVWQVRKNLIFAVLLLIYAVLPWIRIGGDPAILLDLPRRQAFLFGMTFTNQDFYLAFFVITGIGFALIMTTALWGRLWCGYACPQTVFMEGVFRRIERWIEGPRDVRIRRNLGPLTGAKLWRKGLKHAIFIALSFLIAHVFLSYFIPVRELFSVMRGGPAGHWATFLWTFFWWVTLYFNYAWFREQTCLIICPYGRMQSSLIDDDTIIIGYDENRGEPRSKAADDAGDCIDCFRCVAVCPTGIDIRSGLQMECIGCANCIDACDDIMDRIDRPRGLVRYDSQRGFDGEKRRSLFRPRVFIYAALGLLGLVVATLAVGKRSAFEVRMLRAKGLPYVVEETMVRNLISLRIQNKGADAQTYFIRPDETSQAEEYGTEFILSQKRVALDGFADARVPIFIKVPLDHYSAPFPISFTVTDSASGLERTVEMKFRGP